VRGRSADATLGRSRALVQALSEPSRYPDAPTVAVHETHASWVFVAGDRAYKVKKPVALGFLDYSTLARRRRACQEEVRVNQALAPGIYLGVRAIVQARDGFRFAGEDARDAVEYAVEMRRFRDQDTLAGLIAGGALRPAQISATSRLLADFHRSALVIRGWGPHRVLARWRANIVELRRTMHPPEWRLDVPTEFGRSFVDAHAEEFSRRAREGLARDGHGDLRCEHVLVKPLLCIVDRIEFDPGLRRTDVACDLAFLAMDLEARGERWAATKLFDAYERAGAACGTEELRSFYAAYWALVRAKVALLADAEHEEESQGAQQMWSLAARLRWRARGPLLLVICGPAGTGKSTIAAALSADAKTTVIASDAVRKRLAGIQECERARAEQYTAAFTQRTYRQLAFDVSEVLHNEGKAIVDGTCQSRKDRTLLLAELPDVRRLFVRCQVPLQLACERAARRLSDPRRISDATPQIVEQQFSSFEELEELPAREVLQLDATQSVEAQVAAVELTLDRGQPV
jgi:aminoglycoside phosphotransferase family enzyme/predicted kinase